MNTTRFLLGAAIIVSFAQPAFALDTDEAHYSLKLLGKYVFFDKISKPAGKMSCATCHAPETGGTGEDSETNLHQVALSGATPHTVGTLRPPTNAYASFIQPFDVCNIGGVSVDGTRFCGGNFWNGRAEGQDLALLNGATKHIGPEVFQGCRDTLQWEYSIYFGPTSDQALNPFPNPVEQNISRKEACEHVAQQPYAKLYEIAWGEPIDCSNRAVRQSAPDADRREKEYDIAFKRLMLAVGAWQSSKELNSFSSKRDKALQAELDCLTGSPKADREVCEHRDFLNSPGKFPLVGFSEKENLGHDLFYNLQVPFIPAPAPFPNLPVTNCSFCHLSEDGQFADGTSPLERYTDDAYHNIGVPVNPELPAAKDPGISGHAESTGGRNDGGFKTPTLRNVDKRPNKHFVKAYGHNGWFKSLESIVHFYNTAKTKPRCEGEVTEAYALAHDCWPEPEWPETAAADFLVGRIGMTPKQEAALVAYLKTLSDMETPQPPEPYQDGQDQDEHKHGRWHKHRAKHGHRGKHGHRREREHRQGRGHRQGHEHEHAQLGRHGRWH